MSEELLAKQPEWARTPRLLPLQGTVNTRDLGGYPARDGRVVCWEKLYRSDDLYKVTEKDLKILEKREIVTVIDFRADSEVKTAPNRVIPTVVNVVNLAIRPGNIIEFHDLLPLLRKGKGEGIMQEINRMLVRNFQEAYTRFFSILMKPQAAPVLFHCSAGKDRTGLAAALFLSSLGVDRKIIMEDYLMSRDLVIKKYARDMERYPELFSLLTVESSYLEAAFETIDDEFGGMESYLADALKVDLPLMRSLYTKEAHGS